MNVLEWEWHKVLVGVWMSKNRLSESGNKSGSGRPCQLKNTTY